MDGINRYDIGESKLFVGPVLRQCEPPSPREDAPANRTGLIQDSHRDSSFRDVEIGRETSDMVNTMLIIMRRLWRCAHRQGIDGISATALRCQHEWSSATALGSVPYF
jgi:hypothetical protein